MSTPLTQKYLDIESRLIQYIHQEDRACIMSVVYIEHNTIVLHAKSIRKPITRASLLHV